MSELSVSGFGVDGAGSTRDDPMREAVKSYKDAMRSPKQDLDVTFLKKTLNAVNDYSPLKVARNPIDKDGHWVHETELRNVRKFEIDDKGRLTVITRGDSTELSVDQALDQLEKLWRKLPKDGPVMLAVSDSKQVQITDAYSHAFVKSVWAGLPFDLVLAYFEEDPKKESKQDPEEA